VRDLIKTIDTSEDNDISS